MRRWWLWAALGVALLLVSSGQTWVTGSVQDPVLGGTRIEATGTQTGATLVAGALLAGAALLAGLAGTRPVRLAAAVCLAVAAVLAGLPGVGALSAPQDVVARVSRDLPGVTTDPQLAEVAATGWPWVALLGGVLVLVGAVLCLLAWWRASPRGPAGGTGEGGRARSAGRRPDPWDDLSRGHDPTLGD